jgi:hypothetical protein
MIENRAQLIGLLSTTAGYADKHPTEAEDILKTLDAVGLVVVPREPTRAMRAAGGDAVVGRTTVHHDQVTEAAWAAMVAASPALAL